MPAITTAMEAVRHSNHKCLISREVAMFRLIMMGLSIDNADRFLRCLPLKG
jgi:hypothetical protein